MYYMKRMIVVALTVLLTWMITSTLMAKLHQDPGAPQKTEIVKFGGSIQPELDVMAANMPPAFSVELVNSKAVYNEGDLNIFVESVIFDKRKSMNYIWKLRVRNLSDKSIAVDKNYHEQIFRVPDVGFMRPTFAEKVDLPRGKYRVMVSLFAFKKDEDLDFLNDDKASVVRASIRAVKVVEIP